MPNLNEETTVRAGDVVHLRKGPVPLIVTRKEGGLWTWAKTYGTMAGLHLLGLLLYTQPYSTFLAAGAGVGYLAGSTSIGVLLGGGTSCFLYSLMTF